MLPDVVLNDRFKALRQQMLEAGVAARRARRIIEELSDHLEDISDESVASGISVAEAAQRLGDPDILLEQVLARPELKTWVYRYPGLARAYLPMAYVLLLPLTPLFAGTRSASAVARWSAALFLSAAVTSAMLLMMQLSITLT